MIFASYGDNITPPHQALGWIPAVYASTEDLKQAGQRIVYLTNPHVGRRFGMPGRSAPSRSSTAEPGFRPDRRTRVGSAYLTFP